MPIDFAPGSKIIQVINSEIYIFTDQEKIFSPSRAP
jgi:hypothetical protein